MRFITFAVAVLCASAKNSNLANQLTSLKTMVQSTSEWDVNNMIDVISTRKVELEHALEAKTMSKDEVAGELRYLLQLVRDVEQNNKAHAVTTLTARKAKLVSLTDDDNATTDDGEEPKEGDDQSVFDEAVTKAKEKVTEAEGEVKTAQEALDKYDKDVEEETIELDDEDRKALADTLKDKESALKRYQTALDTAQKAADANKATGGHLGLIMGVVALVVVGGGCYCYRKNSSENEGGQKEDKKLFKKVFKGKEQKKATKEEIIPTFAVPAEEQI